MITRRSLFGLLAAPAIVRVGSLMPISAPAPYFMALVTPTGELSIRLLNGLSVHHSDIPAGYTLADWGRSITIPWAEIHRAYPPLVRA